MYLSRYFVTIRSGYRYKVHYVYLQIILQNLVSFIILGATVMTEKCPFTLEHFCPDLCKKKLLHFFFGY